MTVSQDNSYIDYGFYSSELLQILRDYAANFWGIGYDVELHDEYYMEGRLDAHIWVREESDLIDLSFDESEGRIVLEVVGDDENDSATYILEAKTVDEITVEMLHGAFAEANFDGATLF